MKISVVGVGYVGLVAGACFSEYGNDVYCVDIDEEKIRKLNQNQIPIYEPGLKEIICRNSERKRLHFSTDIDVSITKSNIIFIALGTPDNGKGDVDMSNFFRVVEKIAQKLSDYCIIAIKSTVPVGTAIQLKQIIKKNTDKEFDVVSNPEFLREGHAIEDFMYPDRVVVGIGCDRIRAKEIFQELYSPISQNEIPIFFMEHNSAELVKYASNSFLAMKITFANEMSKLCDAFEANYQNIRLGLGSDTRIGKEFLAAGVGYGGSCFPKDVRALSRLAQKSNSAVPLLDEIEASNEAQKYQIVKMLMKHFSKQNFEGYIFTIWGLSFKPNTDDMRDAPSIVVIKHLLELGASIQVNDPEAQESSYKIIGDTVQYKEMYPALCDTDALLLLTEWQVYQEPDFKYMKKLMKQPLIFDGRNIYQKKKLVKMGFTYYGMGTNFN